MKLTCIIPVYNDAKHIIRAITSALNQSEACEVIVIDDASSDDSAKIVADFATQKPNVRLISLPKNMGQGFARNFGVMLSKTSYIVFLDSDDEHIGEFYKVAIEFLENNPNIASVEGMIEFYGKYSNKDFEENDERITVAENTSPINRVVRKNAFLALSGFPDNDSFRGRFGGEDAAFVQAFKTTFNCIKMNMYVVKSLVKENGSFCKYIESTKCVNNDLIFDEISERESVISSILQYANDSFASFAEVLNCINKKTFV